MTVDSPNTNLTEDSVLEDSATDPVAEDPLSNTGGDMPTMLIVIGLLLLGAGGVLFATRRKEDSVQAAE